MHRRVWRMHRPSSPVKTSLRGRRSTSLPPLYEVSVDQSADFRLIPYLQNLGHDVAVISCHYSHGLQLIFQQQQRHAGVIFFRLPGAPLAVKIERLSRVLSEHAADLSV